MSTDRAHSPERFDPRAVDRPHPLLLRHYTIVAALTGPMFPIIWLHSYCRYATLRYRFDEEGVWMAWGVLFKREINLAYRRIQDIHVTRGLIQRWLGLASVAVQTAAGAATPEMTIEGVLDADGLRDFLYARMRGARDEQALPRDESGGDEVLELLAAIRDGVAGLRSRVERLEGAYGGPSGDSKA
ncbi:MAG TPA: PH domain-containing protein [Phycisphaerales bacterium]|nr:PH domain-containing protein [Phycisphaerales bacterium]